MALTLNVKTNKQTNKQTTTTNNQAAVYMINCEETNGRGKKGGGDYSTKSM